MAAATYVSSSVENGSPNKINIIVDQPLDASIDLTGFTVEVDVGGQVATALSVVQDDTQITITISQNVIDTESVTVVYVGGSDIVSATGGEALNSFLSQAVTNNVWLDIYDADSALLTGAYDADGNIDVVYDAGDTYTTITPNQLNTPSILRTALQEAGLYIDGDRRGLWSKIQAARDSIQASL